MGWYRAAAEQDFAPAICNLADKFERGAGVPQNYAAAFDLYSRAAGRNVAAMQGLGILHKHGYGIPVNLPMAGGGVSTSNWITRNCLPSFGRTKVARGTSVLPRNLDAVFMCY